MIDGVARHMADMLPPHTHRAALAVKTIRAVDEEDKSSNPQRMLAHGTRTTQTTALRIHTTEECFAVGSPYILAMKRGVAGPSTTHKTYMVPISAMNANNREHQRTLADTGCGKPS